MSHVNDGKYVQSRVIRMARIIHHVIRMEAAHIRRLAMMGHFRSQKIEVEPVRGTVVCMTGTHLKVETFNTQSLLTILF